MPLHLSVYWPPPVLHSFRAASGAVTSLLPLVGLPLILPSCPAAEGTFSGAFTFTAGSWSGSPPPDEPIPSAAVALAGTEAKWTSGRLRSQIRPRAPDWLGGQTGSECRTLAEIRQTRNSCPGLCRDLEVKGRITPGEPGKSHRGGNVGEARQPADDAVHAPERPGDVVKGL